MDQYEILARSCPDGDCPTIFRNTTTGAIRVRGADPSDPTRELDVDFTPETWAGLMAQLQ